MHQQAALKEHYTKGIDKIEQMLQAAERGREEDRRQMISLQAELGKFCEIVSAKLDDTKTDMATCAQRLTQAIGDMEAKLETTNNGPATNQDISNSRLSEKENVSMEEDEDELCAPPPAHLVRIQHAQLTALWQAGSLPLLQTFRQLSGRSGASHARC